MAIRTPRLAAEWSTGCPSFVFEFIDLYRTMYRRLTVSLFILTAKWIRARPNIEGALSTLWRSAQGWFCEFGFRKRPLTLAHETQAVSFAEEVTPNTEGRSSDRPSKVTSQHPLFLFQDSIVTQQLLVVQNKVTKPFPYQPVMFLLARQ